MFYGRKTELREIQHAEGVNFAVIGARRSGKTSLLYRVREEIEACSSGKAEELRVVYVDLAPYRTAEKAMSEIGMRLEPQFGVRGRPEVLPHLLDVVSRGGRKFVLLLDECDHVVEHDVKTGERLCNALAGAPGFRFVLAGHTQLHRITRSWNSRVWNALTKIYLQELDQASAQNLIHDPFVKCRVEIPTTQKWKGWALQQASDEYRNAENWIDYILAQTARRPALIQLYGYQLFRHLKLEGRRHLLPQDLAAVETKPVRAEMLDAFLFEAGALARIVALVFVESGKHELTEEDLVAQVRHVLPESTWHDTLDAIGELERVGLFKLSEQGYSFAYPAFPGLLQRFHDCKFLKREALKSLCAL